MLLLIWAASQSGPQSSQQSDQAQPAPTGSDTQSPDLGSSNQESTAVAAAPRPSEPVLQAPPVGSGNVLSIPEIRYCLALKQRVKAAKPIVDITSQDQVDRFNSMVDDYNSRCRDFLYHTSDLEEAERDIAPYIEQFRAQGRHIVRHDSPDEARVRERDSGAASMHAIRDAQRELNALGYHVGAADGLMGSRTQAAIELFQRQNGLAVTGLVTDFLAERAQVVERSPNNSATDDRQLGQSADAIPPAAITTGLVHAQSIGDCNPTYPVDEERMGHEGTVTLSVRVGTDGGVTAVRIASSNASSALEKAAVEAMEQCRFVPATQDGQPVVDELRIPVSFASGGVQ